MLYHVQVIKGLLHPKLHTYRILEAEKIKGLYNRFFLLLIIFIGIYMAGAYFGIGMESISNEVTVSNSETLAAKQIFMILGKGIWGALLAVLAFYIPAIVYWATLNTRFKDMLVLQLYMMAILILEQIITMPLLFFLDIGQNSSPFSLGVIAQYITDNRLLIYLAAAVTLFKIIIVIYQYKWLKALSDRSPQIVALVVCLFNIIIWAISSIFAYMQFEKLI
jgi:hypothetical protein